MKKGLTIFILCFSSVIMMNCSSSKKTTSANTAPAIAEKVAALKSEYSEDQLQQGKTLFETKCHKCHGLKQPQTHTFSKFEKVLPSMIKKAKLNEEDGKLVRAYLLSNAKQS